MKIDITHLQANEGRRHGDSLTVGYQIGVGPLAAGGSVVWSKLDAPLTADAVAMPVRVQKALDGLFEAIKAEIQSQMEAEPR